MLERADKTSRIVDVQYFLLLPSVKEVGSALDIVRWSALLKSASALTTYRREYGQITPTKVAKFLILDSDFPRAMHFCLIFAQTSLCHITGTPQGTFKLRSEQLMGRLRTELDYTSIDDIILAGMHEYIDQFQRQMNQLGEAIHQDFFKLPTSITEGQQSQNQSAQTQSAS